jgi:hypothetical protein
VRVGVAPVRRSGDDEMRISGDDEIRLTTRHEGQDGEDNI